MIGLAELEAAAQRVHAAMAPTPQYAWPLVASRAGCEVWVKHENHTPTGSFKVRGGLNLVAQLAPNPPPGLGERDARQPRPEPRIRYAPARVAVHDRRAVRQLDVEERFDARMGRRADRARARFRRSARVRAQPRAPSADCGSSARSSANWLRVSRATRSSCSARRRLLIAYSCRSDAVRVSAV